MTRNYDININFKHDLENGDPVKGSIHIVAETIIVHINDMEDAYIFTPLYRMPMPAIEEVVTIRHRCMGSSEMTVLKSDLLDNFETWLAQFPELVRDKITPMIKDNYQWLRDIIRIAGTR